MSARSADLFDRIRSTCARVAQNAEYVLIDEPSLQQLAESFPETVAEPFGDASLLRMRDPKETVALVLTLDAINFGSGWFNDLWKRPDHSGYYTIATYLREHFEERGPWTARELVAITPSQCTELFHQTRVRTEVPELMSLFARALNDLGRWLLRRHGGCFETAVAAAGESAERLVHQLTEMPLYRDVARYDGFEVPFYKRAQLTAADLAGALRGEGLGRFDDLERLTMFADNLVPHVLRRMRVLVYAPWLARHVDAERRIQAGAREEVEIRATALHVVERLVEACAQRGLTTTAARLDQWLWTRGHERDMKLRARHRTRTTYY